MNTNFDLATDAKGGWLVNGEDKNEEVDTYLNEIMSMHNGAKFCPYCNSILKRIDYEDSSNDDSKWHNERFYMLLFCIRCAHREFKGSECGTGCDPSQSVIAYSVAAKFLDKVPDACNNELAQFLRRDNSLWHNISPYKMEKLVADIFKANYKDSEVIYVGGPGDKGIDVLFIDAEGEKYLIQVKRRSKPNKSEGFSTLQSILGTLALEGETKGIIVTTADSFSYQARVQNIRAAQKGFVVDLIDKGKLDRMIGKLLPYAPWKDLFMHPDVSWFVGDLKDHFIGSKFYPEGQINFLNELYK